MIFLIARKLCSIIGLSIFSVGFNCFHPQFQPQNLSPVVDQNAPLQPVDTSFLNGENDHLLSISTTATVDGTTFAEAVYNDLKLFLAKLQAQNFVVNIPDYQTVHNSVDKTFHGQQAESATTISQSQYPTTKFIANLVSYLLNPLDNDPRLVLLNANPLNASNGLFHQFTEWVLTNQTNNVGLVPLSNNNLPLAFNMFDFDANFQSPNVNPNYKYLPASLVYMLVFYFNIVAGYEQQLFNSLNSGQKQDFSINMEYITRSTIYNTDAVHNVIQAQLEWCNPFEAVNMFTGIPIFMLNASYGSYANANKDSSLWADPTKLFFHSGGKYVYDSTNKKIILSHHDLQHGYFDTIINSATKTFLDSTNPDNDFFGPSYLGFLMASWDGAWNTEMMYLDKFTTTAPAAINPQWFPDLIPNQTFTFPKLTALLISPADVTTLGVYTPDLVGIKFSEWNVVDQTLRGLKTTQNYFHYVEANIPFRTDQCAQLVKQYQTIQPLFRQHKNGVALNWPLPNFSTLIWTKHNVSYFQTIYFNNFQTEQTNITHELEPWATGLIFGGIIFLILSSTIGVFFYLRWQKKHHRK